MAAVLFIILFALVGSIADVEGGRCRTPINLIMTLDVTSNLNSRQFKQATRIMKYFVDAYGVSEKGTHVAIMTINCFGKHKIEVNFGNSQKAIRIKNLINRIEHKYRPNNRAVDVRNPLKSVKNKILDRMPSNRRSYSTVMVFIGSGLQTPELQLYYLSRPIRDEGVDIFAIGVGKEVSTTRLGEITNDYTRIFLPREIHSLDKAIRRIQQAQCKQTVKSARCKTPIDLAIIMDTSGSISKRNMKRLKQFVNQIVDSFTISPNNTQIAIISFNIKATLEINFGVLTTTEQIKQTISNVKRSNQNTRIDEALNMANTMVFTKENIRPKAEQVCLVVTDGKQTKVENNPNILLYAVKPLKDKGVVMFALGVTKHVDEEELSAITGHPERVVLAKSFDTLSTKLDELRTILCEPCTLPVDLALLLDHSGSIKSRSTGWQAILNLTSAITYSYNICKKDTRVALITFSKDAQLHIGFNDYDKRPLNNDLIDYEVQRLLKMKNLRDLTSIDKALQMANEKVFTKTAGMRKNSLKVCVVLTDGKQTMGHNNSPALLYEASKPLKDKGVHVFALAMGKEKYQDKNGLGQIASSPCSTYVIQEKEFTLLPEKIAQTQTKQCKRSSIPRCKRGIYNT